MLPCRDLSMDAGENAYLRGHSAVYFRKIIDVQSGKFRWKESGARPSVFFAAAISPNTGGIESFAAEFACQLNEMGWDITVCFQDLRRWLRSFFWASRGNVSLAVMREQMGMGLSNIQHFAIVYITWPKVLLYTLGGALRWWPVLARLMRASQRITSGLADNGILRLSGIAPGASVDEGAFGFGMRDEVVKE